MFATEAIEKQATYELKMVEFVKSGVEQSLDNLNRFLSIGQEAKKSDVVSVKPDVPKRKRGRPKNPLKDSFLDFMRDEIIKEHSKDSTLDDKKEPFSIARYALKYKRGSPRRKSPLAKRLLILS